MGSEIHKWLSVISQQRHRVSGVKEKKNKKFLSWVRSVGAFLLWVKNKVDALFVRPAF
jgi:hypothetical protein